MRAHYLQHVPFEGLGSIEPWLKGAGYEITNTRFFESTNLPDVNDVDFLVVMGGPMSVNDEDRFPWLVQERRFIRSAVRSGKPVLGVCLGAQLIASAMGARGYPNHCKEIGWFPVHAVALNEPALFRFRPIIDAFHWHGGTFELPSGGVRLARSEGCENQALQLGHCVTGLQFHLETTPMTVREILANGREELSPAKYVQSERSILEGASGRYRALNCLMDEVLAFLLRRAG